MMKSIKSFFARVTFFSLLVSPALAGESVTPLLSAISGAKDFQFTLRIEGGALQDMVHFCSLIKDKPQLQCKINAHGDSKLLTSRKAEITLIGQASPEELIPLVKQVESDFSDKKKGVTIGMDVSTRF